MPEVVGGFPCTTWTVSMCSLHRHCQHIKHGKEDSFTATILSLLCAISSDDDFESESVTYRTTPVSTKLSVRRRQQRKIKNVSENDTFILSSDPTGEKEI